MLVKFDSIWACLNENAFSIFHMQQVLKSALIDADSVRRNDVTERKRCCDYCSGRRAYIFNGSSWRFLTTGNPRCISDFTNFSPALLKSCWNFSSSLFIHQSSSPKNQLNFSPCNAAVKLIQLILPPCAQVLFEHDKTVLLLQHRLAPLQELE